MNKYILLMAFLIGTLTVVGDDTGVNLDLIKEIRIPVNASRDTEKIADSLKYGFFLKKLNHRKILIKKGVPESWDGVLALGREMGIASGFVSKKELDKVKTDGFIIVGKNNTIILTGYRPLGTWFAWLAFLKQAGLKYFPTNLSGWISSGTVKKYLPPFRIVVKDPYFKYRYTSHLLRGLYQSPINDLGSPMKAEPELCDPKITKDPKDAIYSDHTAAFLVPKKYYMDKHPEYFARRYGKRIGKEIPNIRVNICLSNPDVNRISAERALAWVQKQKDRKWFKIADGDSLLCQCEKCYSEDYIPYYYSDRHLKWVNNVAKAIKEKYPDKMISTYAYYETVKAPRKVKPEPNVIPFYCPWYWDSRNDSSKPIYDAKNITAIEEILRWLLFCPENFGYLEYPHSARLFLSGNVATIKMLAKNGLKYYRNCGTAGRWRGVSAYVMANLCVDPYLDTGGLIKEYCKNVYGKAWEYMYEALILQVKAEEQYGWHVWKDKKYVKQSPVLFDKALASLKNDRKHTEIILANIILPWYEDFLDSMKPDKDEVPSVLFINTLKKYVSLQKLLYDSLPEKNWWKKRQFKVVEKKLAKWKYILAPIPKEKMAYKNVDRHLDDKDQNKKKTAKKHKNPFNGLEIRFADDKKMNEEKSKSLLLAERRIDAKDLAKQTATAKMKQSSGKRSVNVFFNEKGLKNFKIDATDKTLISPLKIETLEVMPGNKLQGILWQTPCAKLPVQKMPLHPDGLKEVHVGAFYMCWKPEKPIEIKKLNNFEFRLWASTNMKLRIIIGKSDEKKERMQADISIQPGEQIVRIDAKSRIRGKWDYEKWLTQLSSVEFIAYPQDQFYPFGKAEDARLLICALTIRNFLPQPAELPYQGKAIWLTQYRSNVSFKNHYLFSKSHYDLKRASFPIGGAARTMTGRVQREGFRTFTPQRIIAPLFGIVSQTEKVQAEKLQFYLEKIFRVKLPINPAGLVAKPDQGNIIFVGRKTALSSKKISAEELDFVGDQGFMIRAKNGVVAIAGNFPDATAYGISSYLKYMGCRFFVPGKLEKVPSLTGFLKELVYFDRPGFKNRDIPGGWKLMTQGKVAEGKIPLLSDEAEVAKMAEYIKNLARENKAINSNIISEAIKSSLANYVAARLLWDPMANTSYLIKEFRQAVERKESEN